MSLLSERMRRLVVTLDRRKVSIAAWLMAALFVTTVLFGANDGFRFWLQVLTGNFSPESPPDRWQLGLATVVAVIINWSPLLGAAALVYGYLRPFWLRFVAGERRKLMDLAGAVRNRDAIVLASIRTAIGRSDLSKETRDAVAKITRDAYHDGARQWRDKYLRMATDPDVAEVILKQLDPRT